MKRRPKYVSPEQQARVAAVRAAPTLLLRGAILLLGCQVVALFLEQGLQVDRGGTAIVLNFTLLAAVALPVFYAMTVRTFSEVVARESTAAADRRFQAISSEIQDGILVTDEKGEILLSNPAAEQIYGVSCGSLLGKNIEAFTPPDCREVFLEDLKAARATGQGVYTGHGVQEVEGLRASGERFPMEISINPVEEPEGLRFVRIIRDISERKRVEREMARLANFPRANPSSVFECQPDGTICYANPAAERLRSSDAAWANMRSLIPGFPKLAAECLAKGMTRFGLETLCDGRFLLWTLQPVAETHRVLAYGTDITLLKQAEHAREQSEKQLRDLLDTLPIAVRVVVGDKTVFANAAAAQLFGFVHPSKMIGRSPRDLLAKKDRERLAQYHDRRVAGESSPRQYEATMLHTDGTRIPVEVSAVRFTYEDNLGSLVTIRDLRERKKLQLYEQILPVCCMCGNIRDDSNTEQGQGAWGRLDHYVMRHSDTQLSHTFCPPCLEKYRREQGLV